MFLVIVLLLIDNTTPVAGSNGTCGRGEPDVNAQVARALASMFI